LIEIVGEYNTRYPQEEKEQNFSRIVFSRTEKEKLLIRTIILVFKDIVSSIKFYID
jgi:hypothetical protein